jgi:adenylate kinase family enzyme
MHRSFHRDREKKDMDVAYIKSRINYHKKQVQQTVNYFKKFHKLAYVDANQSIVKVARAISHTIHAYQRSKAN